MKTYKLIQKYPGSFELGHLAVLDKSKTYYDLGTTTRGRDYIEYNPVYWQEVCPECLENIKTCNTFGCKKEQDYEIISFYSDSNKRIFTVKELKVSNPMFMLMNYVENNAWHIHSVKRVSDGEIFTIGDKVKCWDGIKTIERVFLHKSNIDKLGFWMIGQTGPDISSYTLEHIQKTKQPLFTTEDGVDIFEGDTVWHTNLNPNLKIYSSIVKNKTPITTSVKGLYSTKKAAENYIKMNKPCLSLQEITELWYELYNESMKVGYKGYYNELTKIVKQKLK